MIMIHALGMFGMEIQSRLCRHQEGVVSLDVHDCLFDVVLARLASPVSSVLIISSCGSFQTFITGQSSQESFDVLAALANTKEYIVVSIAAASTFMLDASHNLRLKIKVFNY